MYKKGLRQMRSFVTVLFVWGAYSSSTAKLAFPDGEVRP